MSERERFEKWASTHWRLCEIDISLCPHQCDEYSEPEIQDAWEAWQAACPEGWQCVPVEQTDEMINAASKALDGSIGGYESNRAIRAYQANLSNAPKPEDV